MNGGLEGKFFETTGDEQKRTIYNRYSTAKRNR